MEGTLVTSETRNETLAQIKAQNVRVINCHIVTMLTLCFLSGLHKFWPINFLEIFFWSKGPYWKSASSKRLNSVNYMYPRTTIDKKHKPNPWKRLLLEWLHVTCCIMSFFGTTPLFSGPYPQPPLSPWCQVIKLILKVAWMHAVQLKYNPHCNEIMTRFLNLNLQMMYLLVTPSR